MLPATRPSANGLPPPPSPPDDRPPPRPGPVRRAWLWTRAALSRRRERVLTEYEAELLDLVRQLRRENYDQENQIFRLQVQQRADQAEITILRQQVKLMAEVHERDRARVEAETAAYGRALGPADARR